MSHFSLFKTNKPRLILALLTISTLTVATLTLIRSESLFAQGTKSMTQNNQTPNQHHLAADQFKQALAKSETNDTLVHAQSGMMDKEPVFLYRYQATATPAINLGGAHTSIVVDAQNRLKGLAIMSSEPISTPLPSKEKTEKTAHAFLTQYAPDLLDGAELQWIKAHDETVSNLQGKKTKQTGMKAKYRNAITGLYFWVIVGTNDEVMIFERDIEWDFAHAGRRTEKWLYDDWLKKHLNESPVATSF